MAEREAGHASQRGEVEVILLWCLLNVPADEPYILPGNEFATSSLGLSWRGWSHHGHPSAPTIHYAFSIFHSLLPEMQILLLFILGFQHMEIQGSRGKCQGHGGTQSVFSSDWLLSITSQHDAWWGPSVQYRVPGQKRAPPAKKGRGAFELGAALWATKVWRGRTNWVPKGLATLQTWWSTKLCLSLEDGNLPAFGHRNILSTYCIPDTVTHANEIFFSFCLCSVTLLYPTLPWPHRL